MAALRRSKRNVTAMQLSNGRYYLCNALGMSRSQLDDFLTSSKVLPHLVLWSKLCIDGPRRYHDASEWINFLGGKYFEDGGELEEDLLLACLGEGQTNDEEVDAVVSVFADENASTSNWCTQDLWARTAWRIVQDNSGQGDIFERTVKYHPAKAYAVVIDILCLAFHSIAWRGSASCWADLISSAPNEDKIEDTLPGNATYSVTQAIGLDHRSDTESNVYSEMGDEEGADSSDDETATMVTVSESTESEFSDPESPFTKATSVSETSQVTPTRSHKKKEVVLGDDTVNKWMDGVLSTGDEAAIDAALKMVEEQGVPVSGYRRQLAVRAVAISRPLMQAEPRMEESDDDKIMVADMGRGSAVD